MQAGSLTALGFRDMKKLSNQLYANKKPFRFGRAIAILVCFHMMPYSSIFLYKVVRPIFSSLAVSVLFPLVWFNTR